MQDARADHQTRKAVAPKKAIAELNQKTIAEIKSLQIPLKEIEQVMRAVFLLLGDPAK